MNTSPTTITPEQAFNAKKKRITWGHFILAFALLFFLFVVRPQYENMIVASDEKVSTEKQLIDLREKHSQIDIIKKKLQEEAGVKNNIAKYAPLYNEHEIINEIFPAIYGVNNVITSIGFDRGSKTPTGLSYGRINLSLTTDNVTSLNRFLSNLTSTVSKRAFVIESISFPLDTAVATSLPVALTIGMYYLPR